MLYRPDPVAINWHELMPNMISRTTRRLRRVAKRTGNAMLGALAVVLLKGLRLTDPDMMANFGGWFMRTLGPFLPEHNIGRANLTAAFPEKSSEEIEKILRGVWDNLGRIGAEFSHLDRLWDFDPDHPEKRGRIELAQPDIDRFVQLAIDGKPALIFAAHSIVARI
jgi:Kdo2-lipid IVA lauroyltransferase/acyltransferase